MIDLLIVGSGAAGLSAALEAKKNGANVLVVSKTFPTNSQTSQAQGGINAVIDNTKDSIQNHIDDTTKSAHGLGDSSVIKFMCEKASDTIKWLDDLGVPFSRDENSNIAQRKLGGASNPRACYSSDYTGLKILHTLYDNCVKNNIEFLNEHMLLNLDVDDGVVKGISCLDIKTTQVKYIKAKSVILATGGYAGVYHGFNTNSTATTADGVAAAFRAGVTLSNMEYVQFHPTSLRGLSILISESARGEGGYLIDKDGNRFIDELKPRDEVARAIYEKIKNKEEVFLDLRHLGVEKIKQKMPQEYELVQKFAGKELDKDIISIEPAVHYTMGGIKTNIDGKTNIENLYAVGEVACNGVHGANRLGGNSLLDIVTFGRHTGNIASLNTNNITYDNTTSNLLEKENSFIQKLFNTNSNKSFYDELDSLGKVFYENVGLFRSEESLNIGLKKVEDIKEQLENISIQDKSKVYNTNLKEYIEFLNILEIAPIIISSALDRKESRGAHFRTDFNTFDEKFTKETIVNK